MPFIDTLHVAIEKEKVARKEKFKQGFLDVPEIERPEWGVDFRNDADDSDAVAALFKQRGFQFPLMTDISNWYLGFNMLDPVVGKGDTPEQQARNRKLRQAIAIAVDWEEGYGRIFKHKGGVAAHSPLPPGLFGSREGQGSFHNPVTHKLVDGRVVRRSVDEARQLLAEAGYPGGRDAVSGKPLVLNYDFQRAITPEFKSENDWMVKQFAKLGIQLEIRATDFNQYQDKTLKGKHQIFWGGWLADYPDAENFLSCCTAPTPRASTRATTSATTRTPSSTRCYRQLQSLDDGPRQAGADRPHGGHRAAGFTVVLWLLSVGWPGLPAVGAQRQAQHPDPRHGQVLPGRPGTARAQAGRMERAGASGRWRCWASACWPWCGWRGAASASARRPPRAAARGSLTERGDRRRCSATSCAAWATAC